MHLLVDFTNQLRCIYHYDSTKDLVVGDKARKERVSMMVNWKQLFFGINCAHNKKQASILYSTIEMNPDNIRTYLIEGCTNMTHNGDNNNAN